MKSAMNMVQAFHTLVDIQPGRKIVDRVLRIKLLHEEYVEYLEAEASSDIVAILDALADMVVIICGTALKYELPLAAAFLEVMHNNMTKVGPDGKVLRRDDGKIMKPEGYKPVDLIPILEAYGWNERKRLSFKNSGRVQLIAP